MRHGGPNHPFADDPFGVYTPDRKVIRLNRVERMPLTRVTEGMMSTPLDQEFASELEQRAPDHRVQVLRYMRSLKEDGVPGASLLKYVGCIPRDDLRLMEAAIERDFERVDGNA
jgi:hypothetical protein